MSKFNYRVTCDEFPEGIEEDSVTFVSNFEQTPSAVAKELAESYMADYIYDWEDETQPSDLFEIFVTNIGNVYKVEFLDNIFLTVSHTVVVELEAEEPKIRFSTLFEYNYRTIQIYRGMAPGKRHWYYEIDTIAFGGPVYGLRKEAIAAAKLEADRIGATQIAQSQAAKNNA